MLKKSNIFCLAVAIFGVALVVNAEELPITSVWRDGGRNELVLTGPGVNEQIKECLDGGLNLRYHFVAERCARRSWWADSCRDALEQDGEISFDKIQEKFISVVDVLGDGRPSRRSESDSIDGGVEILRTATIKFTRERHPGDYLMVKVDIECRSGGSSTIQEMVNVFTFGLVSPQLLDTGWVRYELE